MTTPIAFIHKKKIYITTDGQATNNNEFIRRTDDKKGIARDNYFILTSGLAFGRDLLVEKHEEMPCKNQKDAEKIFKYFIIKKSNKSPTKIFLKNNFYCDILYKIFTNL